jgi:HEAT repeat protein
VPREPAAKLEWAREAVASPDPVERAVAFLTAAGRGDQPAPWLEAAAGVAARTDPDARVRIAALRALVELGNRDDAEAAWLGGVHDPEAAVRRRAAELAVRLAPGSPAPAGIVGALVELLADADATVVEAAAWALGELGPDVGEPQAVTALASAATAHSDARAREAAVAALGALGDRAGLDAVLAACRDKPGVRRRAVLALAAFDGPDVEAALTAASSDKDWQVRQAAEDVRGG